MSPEHEIPWATSEPRLADVNLVTPILDVIGALVVALDTSGRIMLFNRACELLTGYTFEEVKNNTFFEIFLLPGEAEGVRAVFNALVLGDFPNHHTNYWRTKSGEKRLIAWSNTAIVGPDSSVKYVIGTGTDISERMHAEEALRKSEARLRSILETAADAIITIDQDDKIETFNLAAEKLFGYFAADVLGENLSLLIPIPKNERHSDNIARHLNAGQSLISGIDGLSTGRHADGKRFPIELSVGSVPLNGPPLYTLLVHDITSRELAERKILEIRSELLRVSRLSDLGQMVSALAHEVNQPLTAVMNYIQASRRLLQNGGTDSLENAIDLMNKSLNQVERANSIISALRKLATKGETMRKAEDINAVVEEASNLALLGAASEGIRAAIRLDHDLPPVFVDKIQIQQVIVNLLRNAVEAMKTSSRREIVVETLLTDHGKIEVAVHDTGPGLPEYVKEQLFQPFVTTKPHGIGIGLSIGEKIIASHGGRFWATTNPEGGTSFHFTLETMPHVSDNGEAHASSRS